MTWEQRAIQLWTRLVIDLGDVWLEIVNSLDENGYHIHNTMPPGEFVVCV